MDRYAMSDYDRLNEENDELRRDLHKLKEGNAALRDEIKLLEEIMLQSMSEVSELGIALQAQTDAEKLWRSQFQDEEKLRLDEASFYEQKIAELEKQLALGCADITNLRTDNTSLKGKVLEADSRSRNLEKEVRTLTAHICSLERSIKEAEDGSAGKDILVNQLKDDLTLEKSLCAKFRQIAERHELDAVNNEIQASRFELELESLLHKEKDLIQVLDSSKTELVLMNEMLDVIEMSVPTPEAERRMVEFYEVVRQSKGCDEQFVQKYRRCKGILLKTSISVQKGVEAEVLARTLAESVNRWHSNFTSILKQARSLLLKSKRMVSTISASYLDQLSKRNTPSPISHRPQQEDQLSIQNTPSPISHRPQQEDQLSIGNTPSLVSHRSQQEDQLYIRNTLPPISYRPLQEIEAERSDRSPLPRDVFDWDLLKKALGFTLSALGSVLPCSYPESAQSLTSTHELTTAVQGGFKSKASVEIQKLDRLLVVSGFSLKEPKWTELSQALKNLVTFMLNRPHVSNSVIVSGWSGGETVCSAPVSPALSSACSTPDVGLSERGVAKHAQHNDQDHHSVPSAWYADHQTSTPTQGHLAGVHSWISRTSSSTKSHDTEPASSCRTSQCARFSEIDAPLCFTTADGAGSEDSESRRSVVWSEASFEDQCRRSQNSGDERRLDGVVPVILSRPWSVETRCAKVMKNRRALSSARPAGPCSHGRECRRRHKVPDYLVKLEYSCEDSFV